MTRIILFLVIAIGFVVQSRGQNSDVSHFYIAYDISGSVSSIDLKDNLQQSLFRLLDIDAKMLNQPRSNYEKVISFSMYPFGNGSKEPIVYDAFKKKYNQQIAISNLKKYTDRNKNEMYSDLLQTLNVINKDISDHPVNTGVFIFTDGNFNSKDIESPNGFEEYKKDVDVVLLSLKKKLGSEKVFIIQTSEKFPIFQFSNHIETPKAITDSVAYSDRYFWIDARQNINKAKYATHLSQFYQQVLSIIATNPNLSLKNEKEVAITLQEIWDLRKKLKAVNAEYKINSAFITEVDNLEKLLCSKNEAVWKKSRIDSIQTRLKHFKNTNNEKTGLNVIKQQLYEAAIVAEINYIKKENTEGAKNDTFIAKEPLSLAVAYSQADPTLISETVREAKGWQNIEQQVLEGMAEYIIQRAKMETVYAFVDNLETVFKDSSVYRLFPATDYLIRGQNHKYDIVVLKDAIKKDLNTLPEKIFQDQKLVKSEKLYSFWMYLQLYDILLERGSIEEAFEKLNKRIKDNEEVFADLKKSSVGKSLLLSVNLIEYLNTNDFAKAYDFFDSDKDLEELSAMLFAMSIDTTGIEKIREIPAIKKEISTIYRNYNLVKKQIHTLQSLSGKPPTADFEGYRKYQKDLFLDVLRRTASLLTSGSKIVNYIEIEPSKEEADKRREKIEACNKKTDKTDCIKEIKREEYVQQQQLTYSLNNGIDAWFDMKEGNYAKAMFTLSDALISEDNELHKKATEFLRASGEIVNAGSAEEVSSVIARYTLPVASHRIKKEHGTSFMVSTYVGLSATRFNNKNGINIMAAIGPEYSKGFENGMSLSGMFTLLDLGNIIHYSLKNEKEVKEEVSFARAFSPGVLFAFSPFDKLPIAFTSSFMLNPNRVQVGVVLDMPLFGIWMKNK